jgi:hypothetical protein
MKIPSFTFTPYKPKKYIGAMLSLLIGCIQFFLKTLLVTYLAKTNGYGKKTLWDNQILPHILGGTYCDLH